MLFRHTGKTSFLLLVRLFLITYSENNLNGLVLLRQVYVLTARLVNEQDQK